MKPWLPLVLSCALLTAPAIAAESVKFTADGLLIMPDYRSWVRLSDHLDTGGAAPPAWIEHPAVFGDIYATPSAVAGFRKTGTWPDKSVFVSVPRIDNAPPIDGAPQRVEVRVKDAGVWTFYTLKQGAPGPAVSRAVACYSCHDAHAASDGIFTQFYPALRGGSALAGP